MNTPALRLQSLSFALGERAILSDLSLTLATGEHLAVVGNNGAGKSTLLKCLAGIYRSAPGCIEVLGHPLEKYAPREFARAASYVPQHFECEFPYTAFEFVLMGRYPFLHPLGRAGRGELEKVWLALERTGTADLAERSLLTLSGGERQRVMIAAALAQEGRLMLLDEPMTGLDPKHQDAMSQLFEKLKREQGVALVTATHDLNISACLADRIAGLKGGRIVFSGSAPEFMRAEVLEAVYDKTFYLVKHPKHGISMALPG
jgi:ferric hydroxamate transport system ATP-binding protein